MSPGSYWPPESPEDVSHLGPVLGPSERQGRPAPGSPEQPLSFAGTTQAWPRCPLCEHSLWSSVYMEASGAHSFPSRPPPPTTGHPCVLPHARRVGHLGGLRRNAGSPARGQGRFPTLGGGGCLRNTHSWGALWLRFWARRQRWCQRTVVKRIRTFAQSLWQDVEGTGPLLAHSVTRVTRCTLRPSVSLSLRPA